MLLLFIIVIIVIIAIVVVILIIVIICYLTGLLDSVGSQIVHYKLDHRRLVLCHPDTKHSGKTACCPRRRHTDH